MSKWENHGDVHFDSYGGCLVRPHWTEDELKESPLLKDQFDVFRLIPKEETGEGYNWAAMYFVDVEDFVKSEEKNDLLRFVGLEDLVDKNPYDIMSPEIWAKEIVEAGLVDLATTYKAQYPGRPEDYQLTDNQLADYMRQIGAEEFMGYLADKGLSKDDVRITNEPLVIEDSYIEAQFELWCDVDKKFDTDTRDDDGKWINFYVHYYPDDYVEDEQVKGLCVVCSDDDNEYFDYVLNNSEKKILVEQMQERANLEAGCELDELFEHFHADIER